MPPGKAAGARTVSAARRAACSRAAQISSCLKRTGCQASALRSPIGGISTSSSRSSLCSTTTTTTSTTTTNSYSRRLLSLGGEASGLRRRGQAAWPIHLLCL
eukprot:15183693-Heterocapsa_arctica.AAC.1